MHSFTVLKCMWVWKKAYCSCMNHVALRCAVFQYSTTVQEVLGFLLYMSTELVPFCLFCILCLFMRVQIQSITHGRVTMNSWDKGELWVISVQLALIVQWQSNTSQRFVILDYQFKILVAMQFDFKFPFVN